MNKLSAPRLTLRDAIAQEGRAEDVFRDPPVLETSRMCLRKLRMRDAKMLFQWTSDPEVARYVLWEAHQKIGDTRSYLRYMKSLYRQGLPSSWGMELKESGQVIGTIGIMGWMPEHRSAEIGYSLGKPWWHQGYAPEALARVIQLMFEKTEINRIEAQCDVRNPASARVMEKCGMKREGLLRQRVRNKGEMADVLLYSILREEYQKRCSESGQGSEPAVSPGPANGRKRPTA